jgi:hypothetical protein
VKSVVYSNIIKLFGRDQNVILALVKANSFGVRRHLHRARASHGGVRLRRDRENFLAAQIEDPDLPARRETETVRAGVERFIADPDGRIGDEKTFVFAADLRRIAGSVDHPGDDEAVFADARRRRVAHLRFGALPGEIKTLRGDLGQFRAGQNLIIASILCIYGNRKDKRRDRSQDDEKHFSLGKIHIFLRKIFGESYFTTAFVRN